MLRRLIASCLALVLGLAPVPFVPKPAQAQGSERRGLSIVRDAEVEQLLREYAAPIFKAAGIPTGAAQIVLINERSFNAFVANGRKIFINVGVLIEAKTPNEVIGVIAHETGHIAGGHLMRLREQIANAQILSVVGMLAGAAAIVGAGASGGRVGNAGTGAAGVLAGSQELVRRSLLSYQRSEEQAADRAAIRFLEATSQSGQGMVATFRRFAENAIFTSRSTDPYLMSHPLPQERIASLENLVAQSRFRDVKDPPALQARHDMMRAKLAGFVDRPDSVFRQYPPSNTSLAARYARAIAAYRSGRLADALAQIDALIAVQGSNPYFWELKGQALLEAGRAREAVGPLQRAISLAPNAGLIRTMLGQALLATGNVQGAIRELSRAAQQEPESPDAFRQLAQAYGQRNELGLAAYNTAQFYVLTGDIPNAHIQAQRAMERLPKGSPSWLKAEDIMNLRPPAQN
jgi:predicted Zn-dependent protease